MECDGVEDWSVKVADECNGMNAQAAVLLSLLNVKERIWSSIDDMEVGCFSGLLCSKVQQ